MTQESIYNEMREVVEETRHEGFHACRRAIKATYRYGERKGNALYIIWCRAKRKILREYFSGYKISERQEKENKTEFFNPKIDLNWYRL